MSELTTKHCLPCEGGVAPLDEAKRQSLMKELNNWQFNKDSDEITREFKFRNFHQTMAFVNALAWIAHQENHHPDLKVAYDHCTVSYSTHAIGGLSDNDFICAAKIDVLVT